MTVDTHCHLFLMEQQPAQAVESARAAGVRRLVCVGIDPESSRSSLGFAREFEDVVSTVGLHPHEASDLDDRMRAELTEMAADPLVVGIGETGLDFYRRLSPQADQVEALRFHARLSADTDKPMVVHVRDAWERTLEVLAEEAPSRVVIHCFSGDAEIAVECVTRGYYLSFAGPVTYPKNDALREAAASVPLSSILVETDSPYLAPQNKRGQPNEPANVVPVVEQIASVRELDVETVLDATFENALNAFPGLE